MKRVVLSLSVLVLVLAGLVGCNKPASRSDAQLASDVQSKISGDPGVSSHDVGVQADHGIVTLNGNVTSDEERASAAHDAATVDGVKTVVNNLVVQAAAPPAPDEAPVTSGTNAKAKKSARGPTTPSDSAGKNGAGNPVETAAVAPSPASSNPPPPAPAPVAAQAPPPPPKKIMVPAGTQLTVRLNEGLDTEKNQMGDTFHATLGAPIVINDDTVIPSGADVVGHVVDVKSAGRFAGSSSLTLELTSLSMNGKTYNVQTNQWSRQGKGEGKNTAVKAGGGAAVGAIIGGLAGGGKGAAIGSVAGAGAGTGVAATKKGEQIKLAPESTLSFLLINPITVTQQTADNRNAGRTPLQ
ncbi:MAG TPA: BON domain-containing protein [Candidatus Sulfotelmatobacter sp.]|nr:BON domain-containing protein [Candidatus Sulfotelmatobacter sp.]